MFSWPRAQTWKALGQLESHWGVLKARVLDHLQAWMQKNGVDATSQLKSALDIAVTDMLQACLSTAKQNYDARMQAVDGILTTFKNTISASGLVETQLKHFLNLSKVALCVLAMRSQQALLCYLLLSGVACRIFIFKFVSVRGLLPNQIEPNQITSNLCCFDFDVRPPTPARRVARQRPPPTSICWMQ